MIDDSTPKVRNKRLKLFINIIAILLIYMGARAWFQRDLVSGVAPAIQQSDMAGQIIDYASYQQQPGLLHFWATWCGVSHRE